MCDGWRLELFGGLRARCGDQVVSRFRTRKTASLLAFLAYYPGRAHSREMLAGMQWPDDDPVAGHLKLRLALTSLRRQFEPSSERTGTVILADRLTVQLNPLTITTDVAEVESLLEAAARAPAVEKESLLGRAVGLYSGPLLPNHYESWIPAQQLYLEERYFTAADELIRLRETACDLDGAIDAAGRALIIDPLREETHRSLMRLYATARRPADVVRQYRTLERLLKEQWSESPSMETRQLVASLTSRLQVEQPHPGRAPAPLSPTFSPVGLARTDVRASKITPLGRLPVPPTRFFGRDNEIARLSALLSGRSTSPGGLISLTGPGGTGKTRLAIEAARKTASEDLDATVWFVPCAEILHPGRIPEAIVDALGLPRSQTMKPLDQAVAFLSGAKAHRTRSLLILDNLEQLLPDAAATVRQLIQCVPTLSILVTSRQRVGLSGEQEFPVPPLPVPETVDGGGSRAEGHLRRSSTVFAAPSTMLGCPSVALFVDRARLVCPDFSLTRANAPAVAELCDRLEGIPLAIELAAGQAQVLSPAEMLGLLGRRFDFLVTTNQDSERRHRTLRAALDWSFQRLPADLQGFFARLSVFRGGWTADAAETVAWIDDSRGRQVTETRINVSRESTLRALAALRDRSLIIAEDAGDGRRFHMMETIREYGAEKLQGESCDDAMRRHLECCVELGERFERSWWTAAEEYWMERLTVEHENVRAALSWAINRDVTSALMLCGAMSRYWSVRGYLREGREWMETALAATEGTQSSAGARALAGAAILARRNPSGRQWCEASLRMYESLNDLGEGYAHALERVGSFECDVQEYALAREHLEKSLEIHRAVGSTRGIALSLLGLGWYSICRGNYDAAVAACEESLSHFRTLEGRWGTAISLYLLGLCSFHRGDLAGARRLYGQSRELHELAKDRYCVGLCLLGLGATALRCEEFTLAREHLKGAGAAFHEIGAEWGVVEAVHGLASLALAEGDVGRAARLWASAEVRPGEHGHRIQPAGMALGESLRRDIMAAIGERAAEAALREAHVAVWEDGVREALQV